MDVQITAKNLKIDDEISDYAEKKLRKLERYLGNISNIKLELIEEKSKSRVHSYTAQATMNVNGFLIRGEQRGDDIHSAIDTVTDVMERLITKYKSRYDVNKGRDTVSIRKPVSDAQRRADEEEAGIVKRKRFPIKPMTVDQAIDQMEFIGHDFFIFADDADNTISVVYLRKDGKYGLIQPELA